MVRLAVVCICVTLTGIAFAAPAAAPPGHESSSGVAISSGGFIAATAVWVTPALTEHPYYHMWIPDAQTRTLHRRAASSYTVILLELANRSGLRIEGYLSLNVRLRVAEAYHRPVSDQRFALLFPDLVPTHGRERIPPQQPLLKVYAFSKLPGADYTMAFLVRPLWLFDRHGQIGELPEFELRFNPRKLALPP